MKRRGVKLISLVIALLCISLFSLFKISLTNHWVVEARAEISILDSGEVSRIGVSSNSNENSDSKTGSNKGKNIKGERVAYLTFDDGPSINTVKILDILKQYNIKGTFFVNGKNDEFSRSVYKRIIGEGNAIGNHTYSHDYSKVYKSEEAFIADTNKLKNLLQEVTGVRPEIIRFPGGSNNHVCLRYSDKEFMPKLIRRVKLEGYEYFDWNVTSADSAAQTVPKDKIVSNILEASKNKQRVIILMHDSKQKTTSAQGLPEVIEGLQKMGFKFQTLSKNSLIFHFQ